MEAKAAGDLVYVLGDTADELGASEYYELLGYTGLHVPRVDPQKTWPLYEALERIVSAGIPASCHGIYRGGLAVHAALVALGGGLGMTLDLAEVPVGHTRDKTQKKTRGDWLRNDRLLFSESCGRFLVTVPQDRKKDFEDALKGLPFGLAGEVTERPHLMIRGLDGGALVDTPVSKLKASWQRPFGDLV
jgi:phosphoribosylformylglycinamidine synthase